MPVWWVFNVGQQLSIFVGSHSVFYITYMPAYIFSLPCTYFSLYPLPVDQINLWTFEPFCTPGNFVSQDSKFSQIDCWIQVLGLIIRLILRNLCINSCLHPISLHWPGSVILSLNVYVTAFEHEFLWSCSLSEIISTIHPFSRWKSELMPSYTFHGTHTEYRHNGKPARPTTS